MSNNCTQVKCRTRKDLIGLLSDLEVCGFEWPWGSSIQTSDHQNFKRLSGLTFAVDFDSGRVEVLHDQALKCIKINCQDIKELKQVVEFLGSRNYKLTDKTLENALNICDWHGCSDGHKQIKQSFPLELKLDLLDQQVKIAKGGV